MVAHRESCGKGGSQFFILKGDGFRGRHKLLVFVSSSSWLGKIKMHLQYSLPQTDVAIILFGKLIALQVRLSAVKRHRSPRLSSKGRTCTCTVVIYC